MNRLISIILLLASTTGHAFAGDREVDQAPVEWEAEPAAGPSPIGGHAERIRRALARFSHEPSLEELKRAALSYLDADPRTSRRWRKSPNRAALLPTVKFTYDHDFERDEALDRYQDDPDRWGADTDRDLGFQVSAQWELDELVFNSDEVRVWGALADRSARRESVLTVLVGYYFERRRLQLKQLLAPPADIQGQWELSLRISELTASIDSLTGGALSRGMKKKKRTG